MFEKEAEEYNQKVPFKPLNVEKEICRAFQKGAEFGYNKAKVEVEEKYKETICNLEMNLASVTERLEELEKANEWHYVKDGDLPEADNRIVLCVCGNGYIDGKRNYKLKLLTRKEFPLFQPVYAWKEIVLPELKETE